MISIEDWLRRVPVFVFVVSLALVSGCGEHDEPAGLRKKVIELDKVPAAALAAAAKALPDVKLRGRLGKCRRRGQSPLVRDPRPQPEEREDSRGARFARREGARGRVSERGFLGPVDQLTAIIESQRPSRIKVRSRPFNASA